MTVPAIETHNLGKRYRIGLANNVDQTFCEKVSSIVTAPLRRFRQLGSGRADGADQFWALRDVSLKIEPGEVVGVIGRNGAGKSTLLKVLTRITEPTTGQAIIRGRVGSLLEVGTGFHPELTGHENIYLSGAILGMKRAEIKRKYDAIVDFAEIEQFLNTPVKRYSSGMYVRLAFAVAAHLEPEILLVDEVLAVGDTQFQKKCLGQMDEVARHGRTVLFVSHNMAVIENLCSRALLLRGGTVVSDGPCEQVIDEYQQGVVDTSQVPISQRTDRRGDGSMRITGVQIRDHETGSVQGLRSGRAVDFVIDFESRCDIANVDFALSFKTIAGAKLFYCDTVHHCGAVDVSAGSGRVVCTIDRLPLSPGGYVFNVCARHGKTMLDWVLDAGTFTVDNGDFWGTGVTPPKDHSPFMVDSLWYKEQSACLVAG